MGNAGKDAGGCVKRFWTESEIATVKARYPNEKTADIAADMGRTVSQVYNTAYGLRLKKSAEYLATPAACRTNGKQGAGFRFTKGHATWNKGMQGWQADGVQKTQFKPGNKPQTWKPIGSERLDKDGYLVRKFSDTGIKRNDWKRVHIHLWEQGNGPLPAGHAVVFKDGNKQNIAIENLECITRAELMNRNTVHNMPKELAEICQLRGALNRQINKRMGK